MQAYRFPWSFIVRWLLTAAALRRRDAGRDGCTLLERVRPVPRVLGSEWIPARDPFVLVMNHYERPGLRVWWPALLVSCALRRARGEEPAVRWLIADRFYGVRAGPVRLPDALPALLLRLIAVRYGLILVPREAARTGGRARSVLEAARALRKGGPQARPVGITPEGERAHGRVLGEPSANAGFAIALLSGGETPVLPVGVYEDAAGALVARFGAPWVPGANGSRSREAFTADVMGRIAALLPSELRGPYDPSADAAPNGGQR
jgi:hypothetical protein